MSSIVQIEGDTNSIVISGDGFGSVVIGAQYARLSKEYAINPEDTPVNDPANQADEYSSKHHSIKSSDSAGAALVSEVNGKASEDAAKISEDNAKASEDASLINADRAEAEADRAEGYANSINPDKFNVFSPSQVAEYRAQNEREFDASGFVEWGKHVNYAAGGNNPINEGLWTITTSPNRLRFGRTSTSARQGSSKTDYAITYIAGFVSDFLTRSANGTAVDSGINFPPAPTGAQTYDSATGEHLDFEVDIDPKYGDVAGDRNEAVARAWEGNFKNGDWRFGFDFSGAGSGTGWYFANISGSATGSLIDGAVHFIGVGDNDGPRYRRNGGSPGVSTTMTLSVTINSGTLHVQRSDGGWQTDALTTSGVYTFPCSSSLDTSGSDFMFRGTGDFIIHSAILTVDTVEVVTDRKDLAGIEQWLEQDDLGEIFYQGNIQDQSATFGDTGITTVLSQRPSTYFDQYDGQGSAVGRCVVWQDLTAVQKAQVAEAQGALMWFDENDDLITVRKRIRTIAGKGNGDWGYIDSATDITGTLNDRILKWDANRDTVRNVVEPQGAYDSVVPTGEDFRKTYQIPQGANLSSPGQRNRYSGVFTANDTSSGSWADGLAYGREAYFYVLGLADRLNEGAYHPSHNSTGSALFSDSQEWYDTTAPKASTKDCFIDQVGGDITSGQSGRDDDKLYDAIYASGQGGFIDKRLPAKTVEEDWLEINDKVVEGQYRGSEELVWTEIVDSGWWESSQDATRDRKYRVSGGQYYIYTETPTELCNIGDMVTVYDKTKGKVVGKFEVTTLGTAGYVRSSKYDEMDYDGEGNSSTEVYLLVEKPINSTIQGEYEQKDVIGDPANILQIDDLKDGWLGSWIPVIPDGAVSYWYVNKKALSSASSQRTTVENPDIWETATYPIGNDNGFNYANMGANRIVTLAYTAYAGQTEPSSNTEVQGGNKGLGTVLAQNSYEREKGVLLRESVTGEVSTGNEYTDLHILRHTSEQGVTTDYETMAYTPEVDSALIQSQLAEENGQLFIQYHDGTDYHRTVEPIGWARHKVITGESD